VARNESRGARSRTMGRAAGGGGGLDRSDGPADGPLW
jgi:hypothetical protein